MTQSRRKLSVVSELSVVKADPPLGCHILQLDHIPKRLEFRAIAASPLLSLLQSRYSNFAKPLLGLCARLL